MPGEKEGGKEKDTRRAMRTKLAKEEGRGGRGKRERGVDSFLFRCGRRGWREGRFIRRYPA